MHCGTETTGRSLCNSAVFLKKGHVVGSQADADRSVVVGEKFRGLGWGNWSSCSRLNRFRAPGLLRLLFLSSKVRFCIFSVKSWSWSLILQPKMLPRSG